MNPFMIHCCRLLPQLLGQVIVVSDHAEGDVAGCGVVVEEGDRGVSDGGNVVEAYALPGCDHRFHESAVGDDQNGLSFVFLCDRIKSVGCASDDLFIALAARKMRGLGGLVQVSNSFGYCFAISVRKLPVKILTSI